MLAPTTPEAKRLHERVMGTFYNILDGKGNPEQSVAQLKEKHGWHKDNDKFVEFAKKYDFEVFDGCKTREPIKLFYLLLIHTPSVEEKVEPLLADLYNAGFLGPKSAVVTEGDQGSLKLQENQFVLCRNEKIVPKKLPEKYAAVAHKLLNNGTDIIYVDDLEVQQAVFASEDYFEKQKAKMGKTPSQEDERKYFAELKNHVCVYLSRIEGWLLPNLITELKIHKTVASIMGLNDYTPGPIPEALKKEDVPYIAFVPKGPIKF